MKITFVVVVIMWGMGSNAYAENYYFPNDEEISQEIKKNQSIDLNNDDFKKALKKADEQRKIFENVEIPPSNFPNVGNIAKQNINLDEIVDRYKKKVDTQIKSSNALMAFASFSMPEQSLKKLISDTVKLNGVVVFRGFKGGSYTSMVQEVAKLGLKYGNIQVNPNAFTQYKITSIPAIVLATADADNTLDSDGCALPHNYSKVSGDVTLDYALEVMSEKEKGEFKSIAQRYLNKIRESL